MRSAFEPRVHTFGVFFLQFSVLIFSVALLSGGVAQAHTVSGDIAADNVWQVYTGNISGSVTAVDDGVWPACSGATPVSVTTSDDVLYIVAYSDDATAQGLLHDFLVDGSPAYSGMNGWRVCATGQDRDPSDPLPSAATIDSLIADCNAQTNAWVAPDNGGANGSFLTNVWCGGAVPGISTAARWTWHDSGNCAGSQQPFFPGCNHDEMLIFRYLFPPEQDAPCDPADMDDDLTSGISDADGQPLQTQTLDDDWVVVEFDARSCPFDYWPFTLPAPSAPVVEAPNPGQPPAQWLGSNCSPSTWADPSYITYEHCFCLADNFADVQLHMEIDDSPFPGTEQVDVLLNGVSIGSSSFSFPFTVDAYAASAPFHPGRNCIDVRARYNGYDWISIKGHLLGDEATCCGCVDPPTEMVGWWPLDEDTVDPLAPTQAAEIADEPNGPYTGDHLGGGGLAPVLGMVDEALSFDGTDDYVEVADAPALNFGANADFSVDAWIRTTDDMGVSQLLDKRSFDPAHGWGIYLLDGELALQLADAAGTGNLCSNSSTAPCTNYYCNAFVADGQWHHIAVTVDRDSTNGILCYVDGAWQATRDPTNKQGSLVSLAPLWLGKRSDDAAAFEGELDEVELFDRVLTAAEIQDLAQRRHAGKCKERCSLPEMTYCPWSGDGQTFYADICNNSSTQQVYAWQISGPVAGSGCQTNVGPMTFSPDSGSITVAPGDCESVGITLSGISGLGLAAGDKACFEMTSTSNLDGQQETCEGTVTRGTPNDCIKNVARDVTVVEFGKSERLVFEVPNLSAADRVLDYEIDARPRPGDPDRTEVLSLDGRAPGDNPTGSVTLPAGGSAKIPVDVSVATPRPHRLYHVTLLEQDPMGLGTEIGTIAVRPSGHARPAGEVEEIPHLTVARDGLLIWMYRSRTRKDGYDILRGDMIALAEGGGWPTAHPSCFADDFPGAVLSDGGDVPVPGDGFYYLVRGDGPPGSPGSYGHGYPPGDQGRDTGDAYSACTP